MEDPTNRNPPPFKGYGTELAVRTAADGEHAQRRISESLLRLRSDLAPDGLTGGGMLLVSQRFDRIDAARAFRGYPDGEQGNCTQEHWDRDEHG